MIFSRLRGLDTYFLHIEKGTFEKKKGKGLHSIILTLKSIRITLESHPIGLVQIPFDILLELREVAILVVVALESIGHCMLQCEE